MNWPDYFLKESLPFISKRDVNWFKLKLLGFTAIFVLVIGIMLFPSSNPEKTSFHEKADSGSLNQNRNYEGEATQETIRQLEEAGLKPKKVHASLDHLYRRDTNSGSGGGQGNVDRNSGMILSRADGDSRGQISVGTRVSLRLTQKVVVADQAMPVVGVVAKDVQVESGMAIPSGAKILGEASFNETSERATITWRSIIFPNGRERAFSALGVGDDGQIGISGRVHSDGFKNAVGQTLTRFVGAYAAGSINTGAFGATPGGNTNGLRNAIAQTATDQANSMGENLQKQRKWVELEAGLETFAVLNQPFSFRDPGGLNGR